ncbi:hypothetical protein DRQ05_04810, partial [bacterium]
KVDIVVLRDGKEKTLKVKIGERLEKGKVAETTKESNLAPVLSGMEFDNLNDSYRNAYGIPGDVEGVIITAVSPDSKGAEYGLKPGDVIIEVNRRHVSNIDQFKSAIKKIKGNRVLFLIYRNENHFYVLLRG